ncbi:uncharacterized protein LOC131850625 [Achroia grisella]|uniref:uncharacterized protein LOC131850625 n=1 Tax=Achroia grisella TaxID=688607 RepID=UPI0027D21E15|nr:uncharacterized protein LOC131850625 [Achroia grisella]
MRCHAEGAVLASPLNASFLHAMTTMMSTNISTTKCGVFSGIHAIFYEGVYSSLEGIPLSRIPVRWAPDEPHYNEDNESCLLLLPNGDMAVINTSDVYPYICYKKKTKNVLTGCGTYDSNYHLEPRTGSCYKFHNTCLTWHKAYMTCAGEGGHLAIINSAIEAEALKELYAKYPSNTINCRFKDSAMIGFLDWTQDSVWLTIHGETLQEAGYSSWSNGAPDNATLDNLGQQCGAIVRTGLLNDVWCAAVPFAFICEKSPDSLLFDNDLDYI